MAERGRPFPARLPDPMETEPLRMTRSSHPSIKLKGKLGARDAFSTMISNIIGSGIFSTPGLVFAATGSPCASVLVWVFGGILSAIGALCYAELATGNVNCAAEAAYFEKAFSKSVSFCFIFVSFFALASGSIAIESTVFAKYLMAIFGMDSTAGTVVIAVSLIIALSLLNHQDCKQSAGIQQAMVVFKILAVLIIVIGMFTIPESERKGVHLDLSSECFLGTTPKNLGLGMLGVLWAYSGYNSVCALSEEFVNPKRDLPIGVSSGMAVVIILYVLSNYAYLIVVPPAILKTSDSIGYMFAMNVGGPPLAIMLSLLILCATMGAAHSTMFGQSRLFFAAGRDGLFHEWFAKLNENGVPSNSVKALSIWSCVLVLLGNNLSILINYSGVATWLFAGLAVIALMKLRPHTNNGTFRICCYPLCPVLFAIACFALVLSSFATDFYPTLYIFIMVGGAILYYASIHREPIGFIDDNLSNHSIPDVEL